LRDRALLLVGFAGALRRSELAAILRGDLERTDQGYELTLKRSKGSQTEAVLVPLPYGKTELCPVRALAGVGSRYIRKVVTRGIGRLLAPVRKGLPSRTQWPVCASR
jgi:hypothetical protein